MSNLDTTIHINAMNEPLSECTDRRVEASVPCWREVTNEQGEAGMTCSRVRDISMNFYLTC